MHLFDILYTQIPPAVSAIVVLTALCVITAAIVIFIIRSVQTVSVGRKIARRCRILQKNTIEPVYFDFLTGLPNTKALDNEINRIWNRLDREEMEQIRIAGALRNGLETGSFSLVYQPIVTADAIPVSAEALIRWNDPQLGNVSPEKFIPIAEDTGLIIPIGNWVLEQASRDADVLNRNSDIIVSVNLSTHQLKTEHLSSILQNCSDPVSGDNRKLQFEITESVLMEEFGADTLTCLHELRDRGYTLAVDDFGTGYSSLRYLKELPIQIMKIDRSFIQDIFQDEKDKALLLTIISLAKQLKMKIVAEGVETADQFAFLRNAGCDLFQGYYFSRPLSLDRLVEYYRAVEERSLRPLAASRNN